MVHHVNLAVGFVCLVCQQGWFTTQTGDAYWLSASHLLQAVTPRDLQRFLWPSAFLLGFLWLCCNAILARTSNTLWRSFVKPETSFKTSAFLVCISYLHTVIVVIFRRWGGWRLHLHIVADWRLSLPLGILLCSASPALQLDLLAAVGGEKKNNNLIFRTEFVVKNKTIPQSVSS